MNRLYDVGIKLGPCFNIGTMLTVSEGFASALALDSYELNTEGPRVTYDPIEISKTFHIYYSTLYNIPIQQSGMNAEESCNKVWQYIRETALPVLPQEITEELERDFSAVEIQKVISTLASGKSPGPDRYTPGFYRTF